MRWHDEQLNPAQVRAAHHGGGPSLVVAGPGTGKTRTLVARYGHLLEQGVAAAEILTVTFTRKSAAEFKKRIEHRTGRSLSGSPVGTFNSLCQARIGPRLFSDRQLVTAGQLNGRFWGPERVYGEDRDRFQTQIDLWKQARLPPEDALKKSGQAGDEWLLRAAGFYQAYQEHLGQHRLYDFTDQIGDVVRALESEPGFATAVRARYRHLLVDEFQDINQLQMDLIRGILNEERNLWVVGDEDQSIYGFRGGDVRFISRFADSFPGAVVYHLDTTYRYGPRLLRLSENLIGNNAGRSRPGLLSEAGFEGEVRTLASPDEEGEAKAVAAFVKGELEAGASPGDFAVLARCGYVLRTIAAGLAQSGVPVDYEEPGGESYVSRVILHVLREREAGHGLPAGNFNDYHLQTLRESLHRFQGTFSEEVATLVGAAKRMVPQRASEEERCEWVASCTRIELGARGATGCEELAERHGGRREPLGPRGGEQRERVTLSTIHGAKGLEWETVVMAGLDEGTLPFSKAKRDGLVREERRLAYVGITRARRRLVLSSAEQRGGRRIARSRFLAEMEGRPEPVLRASGSGARGGAAVGGGARRGAVKAAGRVGSRVRHAKFGWGTVEKDLREKLWVRFSAAGKKLMQASRLEFGGAEGTGGGEVK